MTTLPYYPRVVKIRIVKFIRVYFNNIRANFEGLVSYQE